MISAFDPVGPFGHDLRYGPARGPVNAVIHELAGPAGEPIHEFVDACGQAVDRLLLATPVRQPPMANISIRGSVDVAAERSSE